MTYQNICQREPLLVEERTLPGQSMIASQPGLDLPEPGRKEIARMVGTWLYPKWTLPEQRINAKVT